MLASYKKSPRAAFLTLLWFALALSAYAQSGGSSTVNGTVLDPSGAVVPNATVEIHNPVSAFDQSAITDSKGDFSFANVPFNPYHLTVNAAGFADHAQDVEVRSVVPVYVKITLSIAGSSSTVTVEGGGDLVENDSTFHTDVDRKLFDRLPLESASSSVSSLVTLATPGVAADSNGLFHGLGDHAENSFSVDGQPITDQQSKVFSNQIPADSIENLEVISGAPPAEFGDKTSLVIKVTTRSGQGVITPHGSVTTSYGSFGTSNLGFDLAYGGANWGNFIAASGLNTSRFLDPPEFKVFHDKGNEENVFDRVDFKLTNADSLQLNLGFTRSWFQTPNTYDNYHFGQTDPFGNPLPPTDQRSQIRTFNIAPTWTRLLSSSSVFTLGTFVRRDQYNYHPSNNSFADLGAPNLQRETVEQDRTLTNAGIRSAISYVKGIHNVKVGATYQQTFLNENDNLGIVDYRLNAPCLDTNNAAVPGFTDPSTCAGAGLQPNIASNPNAPNSSLYPLFDSTLLPFDLSRSGTLFPFNGHTDVKELALYAQDTINTGNWAFNLGLRSDFYNGLTTHKELEPRLGVSYNVKPTNTILRVSYARVLETPFNENLVLSSIGCNSSVLASLLGCFAPAVGTPLAPGWRNEFHAGIEQAFGRYLVFSGEYIWKYTHNGYDFSVLGNTPITFPVEWSRSKIPGFAGRVSVPNLHGFSALMVFSSVSARFFTPQIGGAGAVPLASTSASVPFRIDHDERFNQTTHLQYQPWKNGPWFGFNWRYDSGLVAGSVPFAADTTTPVDLTGLTADQQLQAGLTCGGVRPTLSTPFTSCAPNQLSSNLVKIPAPGTENDDKNPPRIQPRHLFDLSLGDDNLFHTDRYKWSLVLTAINLTNKYALYNFLSTFSGTHYVTPRALTAEIGLHF
jgi:hypothetical protein